MVQKVKFTITLFHKAPKPNDGMGEIMWNFLLILTLASKMGLKISLEILQEMWKGKGKNPAFITYASVFLDNFHKMETLYLFLETYPVHFKWFATYTYSLLSVNMSFIVKVKSAVHKTAWVKGRVAVTYGLKIMALPRSA